LLKFKHSESQDAGDDQNLIFGNDYNFQSEDNDTDSTTIDPYLSHCYSLGEKMYIVEDENGFKNAIPATKCCDYPNIDHISNLSSTCLINCKNEAKNPVPGKYSGFDYESCCFTVCHLTEHGYLRFSTDPNLKPETDVEGLISSLKSTEFYTEAWEPIIEASTRRCYDDCFGFEASYGYFCDVIPRTMYAIVTCSQKENFLKCPQQHWDNNENYPDRPNCTILRKYVEECTADNVEPFI
jgi:hypothetical protein